MTPTLRTSVLVPPSSGLCHRSILDPQIAQLTTLSFLHYIGWNWKQETHLFRAVLPAFLCLPGR
jgi:hypothetical protein